MLNIFKKPHVKRQEGGEWIVTKPVKRWHKYYGEALLKYLTALDPFFTRAREKCEFEFILTLLGIRSFQNAGWDAFEHLNKTYKDLTSLARKSHGDARETIYLFLYGLIIEADEQYEILANLMKVMKGQRCGFNFPLKTNKKGKLISLTPTDKLVHLRRQAKELGLEDNLKIFDEFYDPTLRNAIFHSQYTLFAGAVRTMGVNGLKEYSFDDKMRILNRVLAYYDAFTSHIDSHKVSYAKPTVIVPHPDFVHGQDEKVKVMTRKKHGLVGIMDNFTPEEIAQGKIPFRLSKTFRYEQHLLYLNERRAEFPRNRFELWEKYTHFLPKWLQKYLYKYLGSKWAY